jgi:hypothetical protein
MNALSIREKRDSRKRFILDFDNRIPSTHHNQQRAVLQIHDAGAREHEHAFTRTRVKQRR